MLLKPRVWTSVSLRILTLAAFIASLVGGCCGSEDWKNEEFREARLRFSVPSGWSVNLKLPGEKALDLDKPRSGATRSGNGAVVTAMPALEDAALILIATEKVAAPDLFARRVTDFIPLNAIRFTTPMQPYSLNGLHGFAGEGFGRLQSNGTPVYFRCMVLDVEGRPVIAALYAEEAQRERYSAIFDTIVARFHPIGALSGASPERDGPRSEPAEPHAAGGWLDEDEPALALARVEGQLDRLKRIGALALDHLALGPHAHGPPLAAPA